MCGFSITKEKIENKLKHRGVFENELLWENWNIIFNSLPLSSYKKGIEQPFNYKRFQIVFNGEIFNYKRLNKNANSDVDYLYSLVKKFNGDVSKIYRESLKWDGFWAICIIDKKNLYFFTDPLGKKQLYYNDEGIGSEIKMFKDLGLYKLYEERSFGTLNTNFSNIYRAIPGSLYRYEYVNDLAYKVDNLDYLFSGSTDNLYELIDQSVRDRLENRYDNYSLLLSGGLDSNIVLHHLLKYKDEIDIVSIENQEKEIVSKIQNDFNLEVNYISDKYTEDDLNKAIYHYEYSLDYGSLMPNYLLFKNCKNSLVLTGDGADELFSGYNRANEKDTWVYDTLLELPYYHNIRIDRMSMMFTKEARNPLMSLPLLRYSFKLNWKERVNKKPLRETYHNILPDYITNGKKVPLRFKNNKEHNILTTNKKHKEIWGNQKKK